MSIFSLILITSIKFLPASGFDPSTIDYCNLRCKRKNNAVSTACYCKPGTDRTYVTEDLPGFRQLVVNTHNELRNKIARGDEKSLDYESAANMHILQYDLELEYLAMCYIMWPNFTRGHDKCPQTSYCKNDLFPGQNIAGWSNPEYGNATALLELMNLWYAELKDIPTADEKKKLMAEYRSTQYNVGHFTQMVWATTERIGCARAKIPNNSYNFYKFVLLCNYAGPDDNCAGNLLTRPVYEAGQPCSKCGNTKCNKDLGGKYNALCGAGEKVPLNHSVTPAPPAPPGPSTPSHQDDPGHNDEQDAKDNNNEVVTMGDGNTSIISRIIYISKDESISNRIRAVNGLLIVGIVIAIIINNGVLLTS